MSTENSLWLIPSNADEIKIGIAGMGKMGNFHLTALRELATGKHEDYYKGGINEQLQKIRICGLCDIDSAHLQSHKDLPCYTMLENLIAEQKPHIMIIATPAQTHNALTAISLNKKIHTFVEKPLVTTRAELDELLAIANKNACRLISGHVERYNPVAVKIASLLRQTSPPPQSYSFVRAQPHHPRITDDIIIDKVIHDLDISLYFFGSIDNIKVLDVKKIGGKPYEIKLKITHKNGVTGTILDSWLVSEGVKTRSAKIIQGGHIWFGDFTDKSLFVDDLEIKCEINGMIKPVNNQIKDELVDFIMYSSQLSQEYPKIQPLLSVDEIIETITWLEYVKQCASK